MAKINAWREEQVRSDSVTLRTRLKNKISALRSRMKQKMGKDEQDSQKLARYQSNFRIFANYLLEISWSPSDHLYLKILEQITLSYSEYFADSKIELV